MAWWKRIIIWLLEHRAIAGASVDLALKVHNKAYHIAGYSSLYLEKGKIHPKHRIMNYHEWFVRKLEEKWTVLDVGCGYGALTYDLKSNCASVLGIDKDEKNIRRAKEQFSRPGIRYVCGDATKYVFEEGFDAIVLSNVLEHIQDRVGFLRSLYHNQDSENRPILLLRVPMITRDWITLYKRERGVEWRLDSTHCIEYTMEELGGELKDAGFYIESYDIQFGEFYGTVKAYEDGTPH